MSTTQEIVDLSKRVASVLDELEAIRLQPKVKSVRPGIREPLEHAYRQLDAAELAVDAAAYAIAQAYLVDGASR
jgi:hypothetical protein